MRIVRLSEINSEMKLANPVYNNDGKILLNSGVLLTNSYKNSLYKNGIIDIYVHDEFSEDIEIKTIIDEKIKVDGKCLLKKLFKDIKTIKPGKKISLDHISSTIDDLVEAVRGYQDNYFNFADLTMNYDHIFAHSVNVALISLFIGKASGYDDLELYKLGMGAILHDVGKSLISEDLLNKNPLVERDKGFCSHASLGYDTIKELDEISSMSKYVIYAHHERVDGKGYPNGTNGYKIHKFAMIVAVANYFDLLINLNKISVRETAKYLEKEINKSLDKTIVNSFITHIAYYPNGTFIRLNSGEIGIVKEQNTSSIARPIIKVLYNKDGSRYKETRLLDLAQNTSLNIL